MQVTGNRQARPMKHSSSSTPNEVDSSVALDGFDTLEWLTDITYSSTDQSRTAQRRVQGGWCEGGEQLHGNGTATAMKQEGDRVQAVLDAHLFKKLALHLSGMCERGISLLPHIHHTELGHGQFVLKVAVFG